MKERSIKVKVNKENSIKILMGVVMLSFVQFLMEKDESERAELIKQWIHNNTPHDPGSVSEL